MHEISLVRNIFRSLEEEFPGETGRIRGIYLTVGLLSNVQPILMQNAFAAVLLDEPHYNKASLQITVLPVLIHCDACDKEPVITDCSCNNFSRNGEGTTRLLAQNKSLAKAPSVVAAFA